jgi:hypothetical protein
MRLGQRVRDADQGEAPLIAAAAQPGISAEIGARRIESADLGEASDVVPPQQVDRPLDAGMALDELAKCPRVFRLAHETGKARRLTEIGGEEAGRGGAAAGHRAGEIVVGGGEGDDRLRRAGRRRAGIGTLPGRRRGRHPRRRHCRTLPHRDAAPSERANRPILYAFMVKGA